MSDYEINQKRAHLAELDILRNNVRDLQQQLAKAYMRIDELNQKLNSGNTK
jgi:predicted RNase H-like nuclease (RuvC/YqgF family)